MLNPVRWVEALHRFKAYDQMVGAYLAPVFPKPNPLRCPSAEPEETRFQKQRTQTAPPNLAGRRRLLFLTMCSDDSKPYIIRKALDESYKNHMAIWGLLASDRHMVRNSKVLVANHVADVQRRSQHSGQHHMRYGRLYCTACLKGLIKTATGYGLH